MSFPRFPWLVTEGGEASAAEAKVLSRHLTKGAAELSAIRLRRQRASVAAAAADCRAILRIGVERADDFAEDGGDEDTQRNVKGG